MQRWHGGALYVLKNKAIEWQDGRVSDADYLFDCYCYDYPYEENRKRAADAARGAYFDIDLETGDDLILVVNGEKYA